MQDWMHIANPSLCMVSIVLLNIPPKIFQFFPIFREYPRYFYKMKEWFLRPPQFSASCTMYDSLPCMNPNPFLTPRGPGWGEDKADFNLRFLEKIPKKLGCFVIIWVFWKKLSVTTNKACWFAFSTSFPRSFGLIGHMKYFGPFAKVLFPIYYNCCPRCHTKQSVHPCIAFIFLVEVPATFPQKFPQIQKIQWNSSIFY